MLNTFTALSTESDYSDIRDSADFAALLTKGGADYCGMAWLFTVSSGKTLRNST